MEVEEEEEPYQGYREEQESKSALGRGREGVTPLFGERGQSPVCVREREEGKKEGGKRISNVDEMEGRKEEGRKEGSRQKKERAKVSSKVALLCSKGRMDSKKKARMRLLQDRRSRFGSFGASSGTGSEAPPHLLRVVQYIKKKRKKSFLFAFRTRGKPSIPHNTAQS